MQPDVFSLTATTKTQDYRSFTPRQRCCFRYLTWCACVLALCVIIFGVFVRLSNAGLSCPDWPTCYGRATWPSTVNEIINHKAAQIRPLEAHKAWREQVHRMLAGALGILSLLLVLFAARVQRYGVIQIITATALIALSIPFYLHTNYILAALLAGIGETFLLFSAIHQWRHNRPPNKDRRLFAITMLTLAVIVFQALLGIWTVTWLLKPIIVMAHLLGGMITFSLLTWLAWQATDAVLPTPNTALLKCLLYVALLLLTLQIALGGWTSANYAALACGTDFPKCVGQWWPSHDFYRGFILWRGIGPDYEGGVLDGASRIAIQLAHRITAGVVLVYLLWLASKLWRSFHMPRIAVLLALLVLAQVGLGIANVILALPLHIAILHNAGAVGLLFLFISLIARTSIQTDTAHNASR